MNLLIPENFGRGVHLAATGAYLPERVVTNADVVAAGAPLTEDEIVQLSGIASRRWAAADESTGDLAARAAQQVLEAADVPPAQVDRLLLATNSPDRLVPSTACVTHRLLSLGQAPAVDLHAACAGFAYALDLGARAVLTGDAHVLAVAAEVRSRFLDPTDRATSALFGDGAGAALLVPGSVGRGLVGVLVAADGRGSEAVTVPAGGAREPASHDTVADRRHTIHMSDGPQVYLSAVEGMLETGHRLLNALGLTFDDVDLCIPHQANARLVSRLARFARVPAERVVQNVSSYGNTSSASCAIALHEALRDHPLPHRSRVLILTAGAGHTAGAALYVT